MYETWIKKDGYGLKNYPPFFFSDFDVLGHGGSKFTKTQTGGFFGP